MIDTDDEDDDRELPDASDMDADDDDSVDTAVCPACRRDIYEHAEACPNCGEFIVSPHRQWPKWVLVIVVACVIAAYLLRGSH